MTKDKIDADDILDRTKEGEEIQQEASPDLEEEVSKLMRLVANTSYFAVFTDFFILHLFTVLIFCIFLLMLVVADFTLVIAFTQPNV